ncbi:uncharacterized protein LOC135226458 [Macrobrachium nipponense]|uniref:uncharacterized protein LOC135226458 n=1 Tax=Macrobrachium nipponense TaxID=159736 RepID=UPI0030C873CC
MMAAPPLPNIFDCQNKTVPLEVLNRESSNDNFKHEDFSAISSTYPNFRVVSRFRRFWDIANLHTSDEVLLLQEWASGRRPVPDLLIVGYTSWMLYLHAERIDYKTHIHLDVLHLLFELHQVIVPLLKEVSLRTKVLVHADTRLRPFSKSSKTYDLFKKNILFHNSLIDWSEMIFWHFLKSSQDYQKRMDNQSAFISHSNRVLKEFYERTKSQFMSANHEDDTTVSNDSFVNIRMDFDGIPHRADPKDHLRHFGLWWWDTTLVLNLATISECGKLYKLNLQNHPLYNSQQLRCRDHHHAGNSTNEVEVLMILNLLCNSVVHTTEEYCCS